jgi:O-antigen ligase
MRAFRRQESRPIFTWLLIASGALGGFLAAAPGDLLPFIAGILLAIGLCLLCLFFPTILVYLCVFTSVTDGFFRIFESVGFAGTSLSLSGLRWILVGMVALIFLLVGARRLSIPKPILPLLGFDLWVIVRYLLGPIRSVGLKDILFYSLPALIGVFVFSLMKTRRNSVTLHTKVAMIGSILIPLCFYMFSVPMGFVQLSAIGPQGVLEARAVAQYLLVALTVSLAVSRYGASRDIRRAGGWFGLFCLGTILFTLSRMASLTALAVLLISRANPRNVLRLSVRAAIAVILAFAVLVTIPAFRERITFTPNASLITQLQNLRWAGRDSNWPLTFEHALASPIVGAGPGGARVFLARSLTNKDVEEFHPHNEYLQVFHDMGGIGLLLLILAWGTLLVTCWRNWQRADLAGHDASALWNLSGMLSVTVVLFASVTGNTLHYAFVTVPASIAIGIGLYLAGNRIQAAEEVVESGNA